MTRTAARLGACADVLDALPPVIAGPLGEWAAEADPRLALWHACDAVEMALRLAVALGLGDWQRAGGMPAELRAEVARRLEQPTLGRWRGMALALARRPAPATPLGDLWSWVADVLEPLAAGQGPAVSLADLRNRLAHGGGLSEGLAADLLGRWEPRLAAAFAPLAGLADLRLEAAGGERAVAVRGGVTLPLWPLVVFATPDGEGRAVWQVYVRRGDVRLVMTPLGAERVAIAESSDAAVAALLDAGLLGEPPPPRVAAVEIPGFDKEWKRDAGQCVGRDADVAVLCAALAGGPGLAWLGGPAGSGKTLVLARALRDATDARDAIAFRFRAGDGRCTREAFLRFVVERAGGEPPRGKPLREQARELLAASRRAVVADGVDELAAIDPGFVAEVLAPLARVTRVVAAGRPEVDAAMRAAGAAEVFVGGLPPMAPADVRAMLVDKIGPLSKKLVALDRDRDGGDVVNPFVDAVVARAAGLPVYVAYVIGDLLAGRIRDLDAAALPPSLAAYHAQVLRRGGAGAAQQLATPLVATLALAHEPLPAGALHALMVHRLLATDDDLGRAALGEALAQLAGLVRRVDDGFALFHPTLRDHVLAAPDQAMAVATARLALARAARDLPPDGSLGDYLDDHGVAHLVDAGDLDAAAARLAWPRLLARLERATAALPGVLADLARAGLGEQLAFVRGAAHHLERGGVAALVQAALADGDDSPVRAAAEAEARARGRVVIRRRDRPARAVHGARQRTMLGHGAAVTALARAGEVLVSASADGTLRVWDADDGSFLRAISPAMASFAMTTRAAPAAAPADLGGAMPAMGVPALCAAAGAVVAVHGDGVVRRWDVETGACLAEQRIRTYGWSICAVGERVAIAGDDAVLRLLDARTLEVVAAAEALPAASSGQGAPYLARVAAVGDRLVVAGASRGLTVVDAATLAVVGELRGHDAAPRGLAAVGAAQLVSVARDGTVALWDVAARRLLARADVPGGAWSVAAGSGVALVGTRAGSLVRCRLPGLALERGAPVHAGPVAAVVALADGRAATGGDDRAVRLVDLEVAGAARPSHAGPITAIADPGGGALRLAPATPGLAQGERIIVTSGADGSVKIWDTARGRSLRTIPSHPGGVTAVAAASRPDGVAVFAASGAAIIEHRLSASGMVASEPLPAAPGAVRTLEAVSPDELVASCRDGRRRGWTRAGGWRDLPEPAPPPDERPGAVNPAGDRHARTTRDDCVELATGDGVVVARWTCDAAPQALAFLDDRTLVVGDAAGELAILDVP